MRKKTIGSLNWLYCEIYLLDTDFPIGSRIFLFPQKNKLTRPLSGPNPSQNYTFGPKKTISDGEGWAHTLGLSGASPCKIAAPIRPWLCARGTSEVPTIFFAIFQNIIYNKEFFAYAYLNHVGGGCGRILGPTYLPPGTYLPTYLPTPLTPHP